MRKRIYLPTAVTYIEAGKTECRYPTYVKRGQKICKLVGNVRSLGKIWPNRFGCFAFLSHSEFSFSSFDSAKEQASSVTRLARFLKDCGKSNSFKSSPNIW